MESKQRRGKELVLENLLASVEVLCELEEILCGRGNTNKIERTEKLLGCVWFQEFCLTTVLVPAHLCIISDSCHQFW